MRPYLNNSPEAKNRMINKLIKNDVRMDAILILEELHYELIRSSSATDVLEKWCSKYTISKDTVQIKVKKVEEKKYFPNVAIKKRLKINDDNELHYRHVKLYCGKYALSEAKNWYVPNRLTPEINYSLANTIIPFGKLIKELSPRRINIEAKFFFESQFDNIIKIENESKPLALSNLFNEEMNMPRCLFRHKALIYSDKGLPISEVHETYLRDLLMLINKQPPTSLLDIK